MLSILHVSIIYRVYSQLLLNVELDQDIFVISGKHDPLARFAPWQIGGLNRLTVADGKQKDSTLRVPAGIVFGQIRSIHRLYGDPLPIWGNGDGARTHLRVRKKALSECE